MNKLFLYIERILNCLIIAFILFKLKQGSIFYIVIILNVIFMLFHLILLIKNKANKKL